MKLTIEYIPNLGSFLDEQGIEFFNNDNGTISFQLPTIEAAFLIGIKFENYCASLELAD